MGRKMGSDRSDMIKALTRSRVSIFDSLSVSTAWCCTSQLAVRANGNMHSAKPQRRRCREEYDAVRPGKGDFIRR